MRRSRAGWCRSARSSTRVSGARAPCGAGPKAGKIRPKVLRSRRCPENAVFRDYFTELYAASSLFIEGLRLPPVAGTLDEILGPVRERTEQRRGEIVTALTRL